MSSATPTYLGGCLPTPTRTIYTVCCHAAFQFITPFYSCLLHLFRTDVMRALFTVTATFPVVVVRCDSTLHTHTHTRPSALPVNVTTPTTHLHFDTGHSFPHFPAPPYTTGADRFLLTGWLATLVVSSGAITVFQRFGTVPHL